jgi:hypothetical protein
LAAPSYHSSLALTISGLSDTTLLFCCEEKEEKVEEEEEEEEEEEDALRRLDALYCRILDIIARLLRVP